MSQSAVQTFLLQAGTWLFIPATVRILTHCYLKLHRLQAMLLLLTVAAYIAMCADGHMQATVLLLFACDVFQHGGYSPQLP